MNVKEIEDINPNSYIIEIKNKKYMMVAGRLIEAHRDAKESLSIKTEIHEIQENAVIFKATVEIDGKEFTGHAVSNFNAQGVEGGSPFEVAETSAVGRALGFAGFGLVGGIATAEEVMHAQNREGVVTGFHGSKDPKYQEVFKRVVQATNYNDINEIVESEDFKGLEVEEKRGILKRIQSFKTASNGNKEDTKPKT